MENSIRQHDRKNGKCSSAKVEDYTQGIQEWCPLMTQMNRSSIRFKLLKKAAKDLERCWVGPKNEPNGIDLIAQVSGGDKNGKFQICGVKKNSQPLVGDERKKGLSIRFQLRLF
ncbi:Mitochondrial substrate carrier family protein C [Quillaja saponaria]|uniref:Mitochondrial substrate carrier family protein C n=1 Tax=Quillaja saponaria TaxID=32244 RepID=A0AAD7LRF9_QUISA|nr:Mitochondrial substrate carrier family protein C [Quillaja saponaria]